MNRLRPTLPVLLWLLSALFSVRAEMSYSSDSIGIGIGNIMTINAGTRRSPLEFTQPWKIGEALNASYTLDVNRIRDAMRSRGLWKGVGWLQYDNHQLVFYPTDLSRANYTVREQEGNQAVMQLNNHPEVGISLVIKDRSFNSIPIVTNYQTPYFCFFNVDNGAPIANCGYRDTKGRADLTFTGRVYLLPPAIARTRDENAYSSADPIIINETVLLGTMVLRQKICGTFGSGCTFDNNNMYLNVKAQIQGKIEPGACSLVGESLSRTLDLGEISQQEMSIASGPVYRNKEILLSFRCPTYANVKVSLYAEDLNDPNNSSNVLSNKKGSGYAEGVGILLQGKGPNDARPEDILLMKQNLRAILATNNQTSFNYVITPHYYKTGKVKSGAIEANAKIVFQYD